MERPRVFLVQTRHRKLGRLRLVISAIALALTTGDLVRRAIQGPGGRFSYTPPLAEQVYAYVCVWLDQHIGWPQLPPPLGLALLLGERIMLRWQNLHDT